MAKYDYYRVIQCDYGYGWDDVGFYEVNSKNTFKCLADLRVFNSDYRAYSCNKHGQNAIRAVFRKELKEA